MLMALVLGALAAPPMGFDEAACPIDHAQFKVRRGLGKGATEVEALDAAAAAAQRLARLDVCGAVLASSPRCDARMAQVPEYGPGQAKKVRGGYQACRSVAVDWDKVNPLEADLKQMNRQLDAFARQIGAATKGRVVYVDGPRWATGCPLGAWGSYLGQRVAAALGQVATQRNSKTTTVLRLRVAVTSTEATLSGQVMEPGAESWHPVSSMHWAADLMQDRPEWGRACYDDDALGVAEGRRDGRGGLSVEVSLTPPSTQFCEGAQAAITLSVSQPAHLRLISVAADGSALQVYPSDGESDLASPSAPLKFNTTMLLGPGGQERLVAVAVSKNASLGKLSGSRSCVLPEPLTVSQIPRGAAVATRSYRVSSDPRECEQAQVNTLRREQLKAILASLSPCW